MRHIKTLIPGLLTACLLIGVAAPMASAAPVWRDCQEASGTGTKYEDNKCTKANGTGKFEWVEEKSAFTVNSKSNGNILFTALKAKFEEGKEVKEVNLEAECALTDEGTIGPGKEGTIKKMTFSGCKGPGICFGSISVTAKNLPWNTELYESGAETRIKFKGNPAFEVKCALLSITCEGETNAKIINNNPNVEAEFDKTSPKLKCNHGTEAEARGKDIIEDPKNFFAIAVL